MPSTALQLRKKIELDHDDLRKKPTAVDCTQSVVVLGDLHGSALKLLHFLVKQKIVDISEESYQQFYDLYHTVPATKP